MNSNRQLDQIETESPNLKSDENVKMVLTDEEKSRKLINNLDNVVKSLSKHLTASQQLNKDTEKGIKDINQSNNQRKINIKIRNKK